MADKKISALTGASTPLAGTKVLPIVQSGSTVKVSVANLTAGRAVATAGESFTDNITQSTAAKGVNFTANTPAAGMTSQLLNDYQEGTFTPGFTGLTIGNGTLFGTYRKVGKQVFVTFGFIAGSTTSVGTLTGITGLPFTTGTIGAGRFFAANGSAFKSGVGWYGAYAALFNAATSGSGPISAANDAGMSATAPFTWAADDSLSLTATYFTD